MDGSTTTYTDTTATTATTDTNATTATSTATATTTTTTTTTSFKDVKSAFLAECVKMEALKFGKFTLKSGRKSPYFFNAGLLQHNAESVATLAHAYAVKLAQSGWDFDLLFGPAYKGIPLAATTAISLFSIDRTKYSSIAFAFDRKEKKDYGDGGDIVGPDLNGRKVVIIDDVITAGTAIRESAALIRKKGGILAGVAIALDRQETTSTSGIVEEDGGVGNSDRLSAVNQIANSLGVPVLSIVNLDDLISYLQVEGKSIVASHDLSSMEEYRKTYRAVSS